MASPILLVLNSAVFFFYKGGYTILDTDGKPDLILVSTGTEVSLCTQAAAKLAPKKVWLSFPFFLRSLLHPIM